MNGGFWYDYSDMPLDSDAFYEEMMRRFGWIGDGDFEMEDVDDQSDTEEPDDETLASVMDNLAL